MKSTQDKIIAIIPARYGSTRFPGKSLALINGKPMIQWVYERTKQSRLVTRVIVATDDDRIAKAVSAFNGEAVMTSSSHPTGTDRIAEVAKKLDCTFVLNVQGDEPLVRPDMIDEAVAPLLNDPSIPMGTLCKKIGDRGEAFDPNVVKVVFDGKGFALYFSRAPIPWDRDSWAGKNQESGVRSRELEVRCQKPITESHMYKHIGLYVYRREFLLSYTGMPQMPLETIEKLEQLRVLERGYKIKVVVTEHESFGVDIPGDLSKIQKLIDEGRA
jgi:3-deoxy-manno-octulosonate cytidylyltransferase (CMP-KDO synthetase)